MPVTDVVETLNDGIAAQSRGELDEAIRLYSEVIAVSGAPPAIVARAFTNRGRIYWERGRYDDAITDSDSALHYQRDFAEALNVRGNAFREKGEYQRAIADYGDAIRFKPDYAEAFENRGNAYESDGSYDSAILDYESAIRLKRDYYEVFNSLGNARRYKARFDHEVQLDRAIAAYDEAIRLQPDYAEAFSNRGVAKLYCRSASSALDDFLTAARLAPDDPYNVIWLHIARSRLGQPDADELNNSAARIPPNKWPSPVIALFRCLETSAAVEAAAAVVDENTRRGQVCEAHFYIGIFELERGALERARYHFLKAVKGCPKGFVEYDAAHAELARTAALLEYQTRITIPSG
jgi:lipoprotein NlpI